MTITAEEVERVESRLGDAVICTHCGATLETYAERCSVPLNVKCPGFLRVEEARKP